jgi:hypothetical protein
MLNRLALRASKSRESIRLREAVEFLGVDPDDETGIVSPSIKIQNPSPSCYGLSGTELESLLIGSRGHRI